MSTIEVAVAETHFDLNRMITKYLDSKDDISVIGSANNGKSAYNIISKHNPDIAVVAIMMPVLDGLGVLEKCISDNNITTDFILIAAIKDIRIAQEAFRIGAAYYLMKPLDLEVLTNRIRFIYKTNLENTNKTSNLIKNPNLNSVNTSKKITNILHQFGVPAHLNGFHFLREAISMVVYDPENINGVTKVLYPELAKKFNSTTSRVERSMRHAIQQTWKDSNVDLFNEIFNRDSKSKQQKPTNSEFIALVADKIRLEHNIYKI